MVCWRRDSIEAEKSPTKSKHVTIETMDTVDTDVIDDARGKLHTDLRHVSCIITYTACIVGWGGNPHLESPPLQTPAAPIYVQHWENEKTTTGWGLERGLHQNILF